jgi:pimeloyl-ACP methyl ester carboxylesterase
MKNYSKLRLLLPTLMIFLMANVHGQISFEFDTPYGQNEAAGKYIDLNGAVMYYEEYGAGEPLLLIHGNGGDIKSMGYQIDYFKTRYRVIIADNRGHGKSELKTDSLTYVGIADDWSALVNYLGLDSVSIIGWSDGGIIALEMGIGGKSTIKKIVAMAANLRPDSTAIHSWAIEQITKMKNEVDLKIEEKDSSQDWHLHKQQLGLMFYQPTISVQDLSKIKAKVLVIAGDEDIIRNEHTLEIYNNIPEAHLCIMPGETHFTPATNPDLFNAIADRFLSQPFRRPHSDWTKSSE